ncbi:hypothetical protein GDO86_016353 [Hymenochirus boettgeri]|nr:hypothetical protein GDO86_016353 [Hymenochirus boettgeri]
MDLVSCAAESLQATYREMQNGLKGNHTPNNNTANRRSHQGSRSLSPFGTKVHVITHKLSYVERVVLEIIDTERMYVQDLRSIVEDYLGGIIDKQELLPINPEQVCALFGNIEDIYELNSQDFDIYTQYCTNYPNSVATLTECMRNKVLAKFFREKQEMLNQSLPLGSYLLKPVQRILKYHLLLQEIAKHLDTKVEGYEVVEEAIETMTGVAWYINDMKRKHEHAVRQQEIQSLLLNWKGADLTTYGELVLEGTFRIQRARSERTFFLFDKALLITKKRGDHFVYKAHIPCSSLMLIESTRDSLCFSVTHYKNSKQQHNVQAKTVEEKHVWTHHIKKLILENHHAIIPQKAKEAILEMDTMYKGKYRYSPERQKKAMSGIETTVTHRSGRRQSEPSKYILKHLSDKVGLKTRNHGEQEPPKGFKRQNSQSSGNAEKRRSVEVSCTHQEDVYENKENSELEERYRTMLVNSSEKEQAVLFETPEDTGPVEDDREAHLEALNIVENEEAESTEDSKTFSSEEDEEEATNHEPSGILPPSVLGQASVIAERFINTMSRRSSLALEDGKAIGYMTPRLTSRCSSLINLESTDTIIYQNGSCDFPDFQEVSSDTGVVTDSALNKATSASVESVFEERERERLTCKRRESLSIQDRQLLDKIKTYYDHAENQDANFSIKRRESLNYIPTGLVRNSVFRINSLPRLDANQSSLSKQALGRSFSSMVSASNGSTSWADIPKGTGSKIKSQPVEPALNGDAKHALAITDDEFRSPNEMIKVWDEIEKMNSWKEAPDVAETKKDVERLPDDEEESLRLLQSVVESHEPLLILEDSDLSTITEESPIPTPESTSPKLFESAKNDTGFNEFKTPGKLHSKIMQLANCMDENMSEKMNKVYQLARQYSQRIKCNKPVSQRHLREIEEDFRRNSLLSVQEEKHIDKGKRKPMLTLPTYEHVVLREHSPNTPTSASYREKSPKRLFFSTSCDSAGTASPVRSDCRSPLSPVKTEKFHWPDVRELRSRYICAANTSKVAPVNRSYSLPEKLTPPNTGGQRDTQNKECLSHSFSMKLKPQESVNSSDQDVSFPKAQAGGPLHGKTDTLLNSMVGCYYVSAEAPLENNKKVIVMEKIPFAVAASSPDLVGDDTYVQIRSPTTREKISLKAVIERCKAYQESDEYRSREEEYKYDELTEHTGIPSQEEPNTEQHVALTSDLNQPNKFKNLMEKFQTRKSSSSHPSELH